jgi:hypothetical protein
LAVSQLIGADVSFTLFDFFAPVAGAFLGGLTGIFSVLLVSIVNFVANDSYTVASLIRVYPTLFAVYYFSLPAHKKSGKLMIVVPLLAILTFWAHPIGRQVWYYPLMWLIPVAAYFKRDWLFLRSLGATFTAHAVGGAAWIWALNLPATVWVGLIPVVLVERFLFAGGISASYLIFGKLLKTLTAKKLLPSGLMLAR